MANGKDRDGRREAQWRRIIGAHGRSGLSIREFCRRGKLRETAFYFWRGELQRRQAEQEQRKRPSAQAAFVPVTVARDLVTQAHGRIEIELSGGRRVHVVAPVDRQALVDVLAVLRFDGLPAPSNAEGEAQPC
jgi:hypothetical protein